MVHIVCSTNRTKLWQQNKLLTTNMEDVGLSENLGLQQWTM
jgi:hypothetical protein